MSVVRRAVLSVALMGLFVAPSFAQTTYTWQNVASSWTTSGNWNPAGNPNLDTDIAQFTPVGTFGGTSVNPELNTSRTIRQLRLNQTAFGTGWTLSGTGPLTAGSTSPLVGGLVVRGVGNHTIDLGNGTSTSLTLNGSTAVGVNASRAINVGVSSTLRLTGNTIANVGASGITLYGGTVVLDNSGGNPSLQRLTSTGPISIIGGGILEFRSATTGTTFDGLSGALQVAMGDGTVRVNQTSAGGQLIVTFGSLTRSNTAGTINFVNAGSGVLGGTGPNDPRVRFTTAPGLTNGVIALSDSSSALGFVLYNGTDFAGYDLTPTNRGVIPVATTAVSGTLTDAPAQNSELVGSANINSVVQYNTLKISPSAAGQVLNIDSTARLNTVAILLAGNTDYTIDGGEIGGNPVTTNTTRYIHVSDPNTSLFVSSNLAVFNAPITKAGSGFLVLTGTTNQVGFTTSPNVNLSGGVLRVTSTNFNLAVTGAPGVRFRGGVLEYDVSGGSFTFNRQLASSLSGHVNWNQDSFNANAGSGGFSAYSTNPSNALTVNLDSSATLTWASTISGPSLYFVRDGHALTFGSTKSNATVIWQNPIDLNGSATEYRAREIRVTLGHGNPEDKTIIQGAIGNTGGVVDLLKTGTGVLELAGDNTYSGNTLIFGGTLRINGNSTDADGRVIVNSGSTLGGVGTFGGAVSVDSGGTLAPGVAVGTLTVLSQVTMNSSSIFAWDLNNPSPAIAAANTGGSNSPGLQDLLAITGGTNTFTAGHIVFKITELTIPSFTGYQHYSWLVVTTAGSPSLASVTFDLSDAPTFAAGGGAGVLSLSISGTNVYLNFAPVPEPGSALAMSAAGLLAFATSRRDSLIRI